MYLNLYAYMSLFYVFLGCKANFPFRDNKDVVEAVVKSDLVNAAKIFKAKNFGKIRFILYSQLQLITISLATNFQINFSPLWTVNIVESSNKFLSKLQDNGTKLLVLFVTET